MDKTFPFAQIAQKHIHVLVEEIGPRPAGSDQEKKAFIYVVGKLRKLGYEVNVLVTPYAPLARLNLTGIILGFAIILAGFIYDNTPWLTLWLPVITIALLEVERVIDGGRARTEVSQYAFTDFGSRKDSRPVLVICAHLDSARSIGFSQDIFRWLYAHTLSFAQRTSFLIAIISITTILGFSLPIWFGYLVETISIILGGWTISSTIISQNAHPGIYSPGAIDNASGVGMVLSLAEYYKANPPSSINLCFLITGAEETGLHGSEGFAKTMNNLLPISVVNLDMVGAGKDLYYVEREGVLVHRKTSKELNHLLRSAFPAIKPAVYTLRSGDYASFLKLGIPAVSLQTGGSKAADLAYHSKFDTFDLVDPDSLRITGQTVVRYVELLSSADMTVYGRKK